MTSEKIDEEPANDQKKGPKDRKGTRELVINNNTSGRSKLKEEVVHKYSNKGKSHLREAVIIDGEPFFLRYSEEKGHLYVEPYIDEKTRRLRPPHLEEYPYQPYEFTAKSLNSYYLPLTKKLTIDEIYQKIKSVAKKYIDADNHVINIFSVNAIGSYSQDRMSTVHYLFVVGGNGTGKSAFGDTFECLGYRAVNITNATEAFWYRVLGSVEYGQVTIIAEEIDRLDENIQIMNMLKTGYQPNAKVPRMNNDNDKMDFYFPFCFKILIAERSPREDRARGVLDRTFKINSYKGYPRYKIKEIRNPQGNRARQKLLDDLIELRKMLLVYKLIHHKDPLIEVDIGLDGRDEELCKPLLQLFKSLGASKELQQQLEQTFEHFINTKNKRKKISKEAILYPITANAISKHGLRMNVGLLWQEIIDSIEGKIDEVNERLFHTDDYGDLYRPKTIGMITDKFGADLDHKEKGNIISFNKKIFERMGKQYDDNKRIKTTLLIPDSTDSTDSIPMQTTPDLSDLSGIFYKGNNSENPNITEDMPDIRTLHDGSVESVVAAEYPPGCYRCQFKPDSKEEYDDHCCKEHPGKSGYPNMASLEMSNLNPQGMWWEE